MTAPERICAPTSEPFSTTTTVRLGIELLEPNRGGQARRPRADDHDIEFHRLSRGLGGRSVIGFSCTFSFFHFYTGRAIAQPPYSMCWMVQG